MTEDKKLEEMLRRTGAELRITRYDLFDDIVIEDLTNKVYYEFHGNLLVYVENTKEEY